MFLTKFRFFLTLNIMKENILGFGFASIHPGKEINIALAGNILSGIVLTYLRGGFSGHK